MKSPRNSPDSSFSKDENPIIAGPSSKMYSLPTPHPDFWLYDGSIVLSVESCLFRVHQTILANHSEIFSDLFTVPQPVEDAEEMIEGCRIVHLPDSESDFVDLLNAIYRPECVPFPLISSSIVF
jgi:BTB/POZ domain